MANTTDWSDLVGMRVQVKKDNRVIRTGYVDAVSESADILWIEQEGPDQRGMYEKAEGYQIASVWADLYTTNIGSKS